MSEGIELRPYFAPEERYPALIGVRVGDDEYETAYVSKAELVRLADENAKLRDMLVRMELHECPACANVADLQDALDENAKLRELVNAFWWCTENFDMNLKCEHCPLPQSSRTECECEVRMRELGVEVGA